MINVRLEAKRCPGLAWPPSGWWATLITLYSSRLYKSGEFIWKNLKEFSTRPNFFYKQFLNKKYSNKIWSFLPAVPPKKQTLLLQNDSLWIKFQWNPILSTNRFSTNKFQRKRPFCLPPLLNLFGMTWPRRLICCKTNKLQTNNQTIPNLETI